MATLRRWAVAHPRAALALALLTLQLVSGLAHRVSPRAGQAVDAVIPLALPALAAAVSDETVAGVPPAGSAEVYVLEVLPETEVRGTGGSR
jgi:hypothetical protein